MVTLIISLPRPALGHCSSWNAGEQIICTQALPAASTGEGGAEQRAASAPVAVRELNGSSRKGQPAAEVLHEEDCSACNTHNTTQSRSTLCQAGRSVRQVTAGSMFAGSDSVVPDSQPASKRPAALPTAANRPAKPALEHGHCRPPALERSAVANSKDDIRQCLQLSGTSISSVDAATAAGKICGLQT